MNKDDRVTYAQAVWKSFQYKAKTRRDMSSAEFHHVAKWMDKNIPLPIVLRAIHEFDGKPRRLEAVVRGVDDGYAYWFRAMGGI